MAEWRGFLPRSEFPRRLSEPKAAGYRRIGPRIRDGAIVYEPIAGVENLPSRVPQWPWRSLAGPRPSWAKSKVGEVWRRIHYLNEAGGVDVPTANEIYLPAGRPTSFTASGYPIWPERSR
jgi:hypothetical protein